MARGGNGADRGRAARRRVFAWRETGLGKASRAAGIRSSASAGCHGRTVADSTTSKIGRAARVEEAAVSYSARRSAKAAYAKDDDKTESRNGINCRRYCCADRGCKQTGLLCDGHAVRVSGQ